MHKQISKKWVGLVIIILLIVIAIIWASVKYIFNFNIQDSQTQNIPLQSDKNVNVEIIDEIKLEEKTTYYEIRGLTKNELITQMAKLGPEGDEGRMHARADWAIDWSYPIKTADGCQPVEVIVSINYTMPKWINKDQASQSLQSQWDSYYQKLKKHEEGHTAIAMQYGKIFQQEIEKINQMPSKTCLELENKIGQFHATGQILTACNEANIKFDDETQHGLKQGVIW